MNNNSIIFIGLNTHKKPTKLAVLKDKRDEKSEPLDMSGYLLFQTIVILLNGFNQPV